MTVAARASAWRVAGRVRAASPAPRATAPPRRSWPRRPRSSEGVGAAAPRPPRTPAGAGEGAAPASPPSAARTAPGNAARSAGVEIARHEHREQVGGSAARPGVARARPRSARAARPRRAILSTSAREVRDGVPRPAARRPAQRAKHTRHRLDRVEVERVRPVDLHDGVEHQPLYPRRVAARVRQRDLRAVRGAVQRDPLRAELRAVSPRCRPSSPGSCRTAAAPPAGARRRPRPRRPRAGSRARARRQRSRPERPVPRWSKTIRSRLRYAAYRNPSASPPNASVADWPGPPASTTSGGRVAPPRCGPAPASRAATRARARRPRAVERHAQPRAGEAVGAAALEAQRRVSRSRRAQAPRRGPRGREPRGAPPPT